MIATLAGLATLAITVFFLTNHQLSDFKYKGINLTSDDLSTALVMPCTVGEGMTSLPIALRGITEAVGSPNEVIIVFGLREGATFEEELHKHLPANVYDGIDRARDMLRHFIISNLQIDDPNDRTIKESLEINSKNGIINPQPIEYLSAMRTMEYVNENMGDSWNETANHLRYLHNIYDYYTHYPNMGEVLSAIPNLKFFINGTYKDGYANSSRERGTYEAFNRSTPTHNQIVSFVDCDDYVTPMRLKVIEQVFKENAELHEITHGFREKNLLIEHKEDQIQVCPDELDMRHMLCEPVPERGYSDEEYEDLFASVFDFRDQDKKMNYYNRIKTEEYLHSVNDPPARVIDPWNPHEGNQDLVHLGHFGWFVGVKQPFFSDLPHYNYSPCANGHTSWRREWLINEIEVFPDTLLGEDARLTYASLSLGANALGLHLPLTTVIVPGGSTKRSGLEQVIHWNRDQNI